MHNAPLALTLLYREGMRVKILEIKKISRNYKLHNLAGDFAGAKGIVDKGFRIYFCPTMLPSL